MDCLKASVDRRLPQVIELRRYFHTYPELSTEEFNTQRKIIAELEGIGLEPRPIAGTGVVVDIQGSVPGKLVAIRADIDALPIQDEIERPYRSQNHGVCHACGHDGHIAIVLGIAQVLLELRQEIHGTVRLIFQPSEERFPGGAVRMVEEGGLDGVSAIIGAHLWQPLPVGVIGLAYDKMMASPDEFTITVKGMGGHGSMPHQTVDALLVGAQIAVALNTIVSRSVNPLEPVALSLGVFKAGEAFNIIPDTATLKGTVRTFEPSARARIFERIEKISHGICEASGATCIIEKFYGFPPVINDREIAETVASAARSSLGDAGVIEVAPVMVGEDFSIYQQHVPGAFVFVGCGNPDAGIVYPHHHPRFDIDERSLGYGMEVMTHAALSLLTSVR